MENSSRFFANTSCAYFPCHKQTDPENFNCLFCYCPLYVLGSRCGGNYSYRPNGYKDCTACTFPHQPENYDRIVARYPEIVELMRCQENSLKDEASSSCEKNCKRNHKKQD